MVPGLANGTAKNGLSGPVGSGSAFDRVPSTATTVGSSGTGVSGATGAGGVGATEGNETPCTVIWPWPTPSGWTVSALWTALTVPFTRTLSHWSPTSPNPPSLNCELRICPLFVAELSYVVSKPAGTAAAA